MSCPTLLTTDAFMFLERQGVLSCAGTLLSNQSFVNAGMCAIVVDWIVEVCHSNSVKDDTAHLSVAIFHATIDSIPNIPLDKLQCYALGCMVIAAKKEEVSGVDMDRFVKLDETSTLSDIIACEAEVFGALDGDLNFVTVLQALRMLNTDVTPLFHTSCKYMSELVLHGRFPWPPSLIATAIHAYFCGFYSVEQVVNIFNIPNKMVLKCMHELVTFCAKFGNGTLQYVRKKYNRVSSTITFTTNRSTHGWISPDFILKKTQHNYYTFEKPQILSELGSGTYGTVRKARTTVGDIVAYKKTRPEFCEEGLDITFVREVSMLRLFVNNPHIVNLKAFNNKGMLLECASMDLKLYLEKYTCNFEIQKDFATQLCTGLYSMHRMGVLHRDVKPQNILVFVEGGVTTLKYADFGLARGSGIPEIPEAERYTHEVVTLWYRPPEILLGCTTYDQRVDVWSLGCTLYHLVTRHSLFTGTSEIDQLHKIFKVMGTPTEETWPGVSALIGYNVGFPIWKKNDDVWTGLEEKAHPLVYTLIEGAVTMNVQNRAHSLDLMKIVGENIDELTRYAVDTSPVKG